MSIPVNEIATLLQSGQATMTPETAAIAAETGVPFAFPASPGAVPQFTAALDAAGGTVMPAPAAGLSGAQAQQQSNTEFNQYLANNGGAAAEQAAGISAPASTAPNSGAPAFSWLDPFPWLKSEGLNILLIIVGVITIIIVVTALFRGAADSSPVRYTRDNARAAIGAAKAAQKTGSELLGGAESAATDLAVVA